MNLHGRDLHVILIIFLFCINFRSFRRLLLTEIKVHTKKTCFQCFVLPLNGNIEIYSLKKSVILLFLCCLQFSSYMIYFKYKSQCSVGENKKCL